MASHPHFHHHCRPTPATSYGCCCYSSCCTPPPPDPLIQSVASHIHHHPPPQPHLYSPYLNPPSEPQSFHQSHAPYHQLPTHQRKYHEFENSHHYHQQSQTQPIVSSLLRRIAALESSLRRQCSVTPSSYFSLRDAAARTIQTHFRAFLVRRSRTLGQLKDLASIKSALNALKTSPSGNAHFDSQTVLRKARNLLLKLDSVQGSDPMIRDGKRSIRRDIIRFIGFIDEVSLKRNEVSSIALKNVRVGGTSNKSRDLYGGQKIVTAEFGASDGRVLMEKLRGPVENIPGFSRVSENDDEEEGFELDNPRISINAKVGSPHRRKGVLVKRHGGVQPKVKKSVSFADNGNVSRAITTSEPITGRDANSSDGSDSIDDEKELVDNLSREVKEFNDSSNGSDDDEEANSENGGSYVNVSARNLGRNLRAEDSYEICGHFQGEDGNYVFSAPLPVKMEARADLMKRKALR